MTQQDVLNFLKKNKTKWFNTKEIGKQLKISSGSVTSNLNKLLKYNEVRFKETKAFKPNLWKFN